MREKILAMDYYNDIDNHVWKVNMDVYYVLMGYATYIDPIEAVNLYKATSSDFSFNNFLLDQLEYSENTSFKNVSIELGNFDSESINTLYKVEDLPRVISFINDKIIPSIEVLPKDEYTYSLWPLANNDMNKYLSSFGGIMKDMSPDSCEKGSLDYYIFDLKELFKDLVNDVFIESIIQNKMYKVIIY